MTLRTVSPAELVSSDASDRPRRFRLHPERASVYASRLHLRHTGPDLEIDAFRPLSGLDEANREDSAPLTYLSARRFAAALVGRRGLTVVTTAELRSSVPAENGVLLTDNEPLNAFYSILDAARCLGFFECLETFRSGCARVSPAAVISPNVYVADHAEIGPGAVILPNTYVGPGVIVRPNAVIGSDGFAVASGDERRIVTHAGGVWLATAARVGACACVDKGLFGNFTQVGSYTFVDNLVHFGHSARAGRGCSITAGAGIHGSAVLEDGVWLGPNTQINQNIHIGAHCYIGTGSVVVRDIEAYSLAYGCPARTFAQVCECRAKLAFEDGHSECDVCGKKYVLVDGHVQRQ